MGVNLHLAASFPATRTTRTANNTPATQTTRTGNNTNGHRAGHSNNNNNGRGTRKKFAISDLPFTHWNVDSRKWRLIFVPSLLAWAGTQSDPFGTNSQMTDEVTALWERVYPAIALNDERMSVVTSVVCTFSDPS
jgi:hypothetical protein